MTEEIKGTKLSSSTATICDFIIEIYCYKCGDYIDDEICNSPNHPKSWHDEQRSRKQHSRHCGKCGVEN